MTSRDEDNNYIIARIQELALAGELGKLNERGGDIAKVMYRLRRFAESERAASSWEKEAAASDEVVAEATDLLADIEVWANGSTTFPPTLLSRIRLFIGPKRCGVCKSGIACAVHPEEVYVDPEDC